MAKIFVRDIKPTGADLFDDAESFLNEVSNDELESAIGGLVLADSVLVSKTINTFTSYPTTFTIIRTTTLPYTSVIL